MTKLYVSGPMSGIEDHNRPAFHDAATRLRASGHEVVNPAELDEDLSPGEEWAWEDYLRRDLRHLLDCEGIATLDGWTRSRGACLEVHVAGSLGMPFSPVEAWLLPRVVALTGFATSGKDTAAQALTERGYRRLAFADVLKELAFDLGWNGEKDGPGRKFLEDLGHNAREHLGDDVWVRPVRRLIEAQPNGRFVITDLRYPNELALVRELGGAALRIQRPGVTPGGPSDRRLDHESLPVVRNEGTVADLHSRLLDVLLDVGDSGQAPLAAGSRVRVVSDGYLRYETGTIVGPGQGTFDFEVRVDGRHSLFSFLEGELEAL